MTIIRGGLIGAIGSAAGSNATTLALSAGVACFAGSFSGVTTTSIGHNLGTEDIVVEFRDSAGNLLVPNNWQVINPNVLDVDFGSPKSGRAVIIGCIESGLAPITGGVTLVEGLSGIIDLDSPNGSISITTSGQVINLNAIFTPASGAVLEQTRRDIDTLSGLIGTGSSSGTTGKAALDFTPASGYVFVLEHGLQTTDFTFTMWNTENIPRMLMQPENVYPSGINHAVVVLDVPASGRIVLVG
jgi:hypothetical protein